ncbi:MAG: sulfatase-like hydrolase/transferase, partial [Candidatus Hydrogenedentota bacterium]
WLDSHDDDAVAHARAFMESPTNQPRFQYLHLMSPHSPYRPPEPFLSRFVRPRKTEQNDEDFEHQNLIDLYDAEIAYVDSLLGEYFDFLRESDQYHSALIVVMSDHGEEFHEHGGTSHGKTLYNEQLKVPLLVKLPRNRLAGTHNDHIIETVDLAPSVLEYIGLQPEPGFQGLSFASASKSRRPIAYSSLRLDEKSMEAAQTDTWKLIVDHNTRKKQWFNLINDPGELHPIAAAPQDPDPLLRHIQKMSRMGTDGLHLMFTHDSTRPVNFTGKIKGITNYELNYPEELTETELSGDTLSFSINMPEANNKFLPSSKWRRSLDDPLMQKLILIQQPDDFMSEMDYAEFVIPLALDDPITLDIQLDDTTVPHQIVNLGIRGNHASLTNLKGEPQLWIAGPFEFSLESLPRETSVNIWYVPPADAIRDDELDPELKEALRGLGYLD